MSNALLVEARNARAIHSRDLWLRIRRNLALQARRVSVHELLQLCVQAPPIADWIVLVAHLDRVSDQPFHASESRQHADECSVF